LNWITRAIAAVIGALLVVAPVAVSAQETFVVAYYFIDEMDGASLGPLHIGGFNHRTREWKTVAPKTKGLAGSVTSIDVTRTHALVDLHANPSSNASTACTPAGRRSGWTR
jgi:hypothetical protein